MGFGDCVTFVYVAFRTSFCLLLRLFPFGESAVAYLFVYCVEGVAVTLGLGFGNCATSIYVAVILTFLPLVEISLFVNLPLFLLLSAVQQSLLSWFAFPSFTLPSGYLFVSGRDLSFLVNLPFASRMPCGRILVTVINVRTLESAAPKEIMNSGFFSRPVPEDFALDFLCSILLRDEMMVPTHQRGDYLLAFSS